MGILVIPMIRPQWHKRMLRLMKKETGNGELIKQETQQQIEFVFPSVK